MERLWNLWTVNHADRYSKTGRNVRIVEYIPPRRDALDGGLLFQGEYRVWHLRVTDVRRFTDRGEALAHNPR